MAGILERFKRAYKELTTPIPLKGKDGRELTVAIILGRDDVSRTLSKFNDDYLKDSKAVVIIRESIDGDIDMLASDNLDAIRSAGIIAIASSMLLIEGNGNDLE